MLYDIQMKWFVFNDQPTSVNHILVDIEILKNIQCLTYGFFIVLLRENLHNKIVLEYLQIIIVKLCLKLLEIRLKCGIL